MTPTQRTSNLMQGGSPSRATAGEQPGRGPREPARVQDGPMFSIVCDERKATDDP
jgi:hypothetical protein